jgi:hypothetical protein
MGIIFIKSYGNNALRHVITCNKKAKKEKQKYKVYKMKHSVY